jgi:RNA polymerase sigma factor (sigma-70 family)
MGDREVVAAIVAGDPAGLAEAYDRYAPVLHAYCRSLLTEPADAADVVQDTFLIAASKVASLRDPGRFRPWLYAVARNECHRRLRGHARTAGLDEAGDVSDQAADLSAELTRDDLRELVSAAVAGLNPGDREVIELTLRHEIQGPDLADALGVPLKQAHALASRARGQFEASLGALLVARGGLRACAGLSALLTGWDGQLTVLLRKRINRHIAHCGVCGERRRHELSPAALFAALPLVVLPEVLRHDVLALASDAAPDAVAYRAQVLARAEPFHKSGFPAQISRPGRIPAQVRQTLATGAGFAALAVAGAVLGTALFHGGQHSPAPGAHGAGGRQGAHSTPPTAAGRAPGQPSPGPALAAPNPTPVMVTTGSPGVSPAPGQSGSPTPAPAQGTLTAAPVSVTLALALLGAEPTGSFTLTAHGGPVAFTITVPANYASDLSVQPATGLLGDGQSIQVQLTLRQGISVLTTKLTIEPGTLHVNVIYVAL